MGHSKKFYRKKQRKNKKASKSRKKRRRAEKKNKAAAAAAAASISEKNKDSDSHDLETVAAFRVSIADTYTNTKWKGPHVLNSAGYSENRAGIGIPTSRRVFIPNTETPTGTDDPQATTYSNDLESRGPNGDGVFIPKMEIRNISDDRTPPATIYAYDLKIWDRKSNGDFIPEMEMHTIFDAATPYDYELRSWNLKDDKAKTEMHTGCDDQSTPATRSCGSVDLKTMAALGVSVFHTHKFPKYRGPVLNSADDMKSWIPSGDEDYIAKPEILNRRPDQTTPATTATRSCGSVDLKTMAALGVSVVHTHKFPKYRGPVLNSADDMKSWIPSGDEDYIAKPEVLNRRPDQTTPATTATRSCGSVDLETMAGLGISVIHTHKIPRYCGPPVLNSADGMKSWSPSGDEDYIAKPEILNRRPDQTTPATTATRSAADPARDLKLHH